MDKHHNGDQRTLKVDLPNHRSRIETLAQQLQADSVDVALILQNVDLFYYLGTVPKGVLVVSSTGQAIVGVMKGIGRARRESSLATEDFVELRSFKHIRDLLSEVHVSNPTSVGLEEDVLPMGLGRGLLRDLAATNSVDISHHVRNQRAVKDEHELTVMREAARCQSRVFEHAKEVIRPGRTELEVAADLERHMRRLGHQGLIRMRAFNGELFYGAMGTGRSTGDEQAFDGPVGVTGLYPAVPQFCGNHEIRPDDTIMLDLVFGLGGYLVDTARLYAFAPPPEKVQRAHNLALEIQDQAAQMMVPGASPETIYQMALDKVEAANLAAEFMGWGSNKVRFIGHGVGLELDELPVIAPKFREPLKEGMTVALEPKFFFANEASAGLENTFVVRSSGPAECLTPSGHPIIVVS